MEVSASAPGKVFLVGEYAVALGAPSVAATVDWRVPVVARARAGSGRLLVASGRDRFAATLERETVEGVPARVRFPVAAALVCARSFDLSGLDVEIETGEPAEGAGGGKVGLGSSAAVTAATVTALHALSRGSHDGPEVLARRAAVGVQAHRLAQGGGSGADVVASIHGGIVWSEGLDLREPPRFASERLPTSFSVERLTLPREVEIAVVATGRPAASNPRVSRFLEIARGRGRLGEDGARLIATWSEAMRSAALEFRDACRQADRTGLLAAFRRARDLLGRLAALAGLPIWTRELRRACQVLPESPWVSVKPSGAGGGDCAVALLPPSMRGALRDAWQAGGLIPLDVMVTEAGARIDSRTPGEKP